MMGLNMANQLWTIFTVLSVMTSLTSQGFIDLSGLLGSKNTSTTTPTPQISQQTYTGQQGYNQYNQHNNQYNHQQQNKQGLMKPGLLQLPQLPQKPMFPQLPSKDNLKQDLKLDLNLNKFDINKPELNKFDLNKPDKLDLKQDKLNKTNDYNQSNYSGNPGQYSYSQEITPPVPFFDDGSYSQGQQYGPTQQYGSPQQYGRPSQYNGGQFRGAQPHVIQSHPVSGNTNNLYEYNIYRQMYGYGNSGPKAPNYGRPPPPPPRPVYSQPPIQHQNYGQRPNTPAYGAPPSYHGQVSGYGGGAAHDQGYHQEPNYHGVDQNYGNSYNSAPDPIDYSKIISPMPYSEVSEYISPAQYNDYTGMLYQAYNVAAPTPRPYTASNYTNKYSNDNRMSVAVVVIEGSIGSPNSNNNIKGTLYINEIYPSVCLLSGVITGLPPNYNYGIAIHEFGDLSNGCASIGGHYNPYHKNHGNLNQPQSHVGDLGNLKSNLNGIAFVNKISRNQFSILGQNPVAGRSIGICDKQDDFGQGGTIESLKDGSCTGIQACGIIGLQNSGATSPYSTAGGNSYSGGGSYGGGNTYSGGNSYGGSGGQYKSTQEYSK